MAGNNDFNIQIGIELDNNGQKLLDRWGQIKKTIEEQGLNIKFSDNINETLKGITQVSSQIQNLTKQIENLNGNKNLEIFNSKEANMKIQGTLKSLEQVQQALRNMGLYNQGEVKINIKDIDKSTQEINRFIATVKDNQGILKEFQFSLANMQNGNGLNLTGYTGELTKISDTTHKVLNDLDKFKEQYQEKLNSMKNDFGNIGFLDNDIVKNFENKLNNLNINTFKQKSEEIKNEFKSIQSVFNNSISNLKNINNFKNTYSDRIDNLRNTSQYLSPNEINNVQNQINGLNGKETALDLKQIENAYNSLIQKEQRYSQQVKDDVTNTNKIINEQVQLYNTLANQQERLKSIRANYSNKLDTNSQGYKQLEGEYDSLIQKLEQYKIAGNKISVEESAQLKSDINNFNQKKNSIIESTKAIEQYGQALQALQGKFGSIISQDEKLNSMVNELKTNIQALNNSSNFKGDSANITNQINQLKTLAMEKERIDSLGTNVGSFGNTGLSMNSNIKDIEGYVKSLSGVKSSVTSISEAVDSMGNKIKTAHVSVNEGNNIYSKYKLNLDATSESAYKTTESIQNLASKHGNLGDQLISSATGMAKWMASATLLFGSLEQLKKGIEDVIAMNTAMTTLGITMIASKTELKDMSQQIQQTAIQLGTSVERVTDAVKTYASTSESVNTIMAKTIPDVMLANVTGLNPKETTDAVHGILNQYNLLEGDIEKTSEHITDSLIMIGKNLALDFTQSIDDMSKGIQQVGSVAAETGKQTFEQTSAMIGAIEEKSRISGNQIANGLKTIMARVYQSKSIDPDVTDEDMSKTSKMLSGLGVSVRDESGSFRNFTDIVKDLNQAMKGMTDSQKAAIVQQGAGVKIFCSL